MALHSKFASAVPTPSHGAVSHPRVDEWSSRYADFSHLTKRESSRANASITIGAPCSTRSGSTMILKPSWADLRLSSPIPSRLLDLMRERSSGADELVRLV